MDKNQFTTPLLDALLKYARSSPSRFHVPGHGGGKGAPPDLAAALGGAVFSMDVTELPGLDDLNSPSGVIARAQELASRAFGADRSFFLANGTTLGLQALLLAVGQPGDKLILPRNSHRSIIGGLILAGIEPIFLTPTVVPGFNFAAGVPVANIGRALADHPGVCALLCIHPTYYGTTGNTAGASIMARAAGIPLLADEAHGSHLYFHPQYPPGALEAGSDAAVQSMHKTGGSLTQSSILHIKGPLLDGHRVFSYILMASLDAARRQLAVRGNDLLQEVLEVSGEVRYRLSAISGIEVFGARYLDGDGVFDYDPSRLVVRVSGAGIQGYLAAQWLAGQGIFVELADRDNIVLVLGPGIDREDCRILVRAVGDLAAREGLGRALTPTPEIPCAGAAVKLREAWFAPSRPVRLGDSAGRVAGEWVAVYPPGIPVLIPGEEITTDMVNYLVEARETGARFQGPDNPALDFIRVLE